MRVVLTKQAKADVAAAAEYYERAREGLGAEFLDCVEDGIDKIAANPLAYRKIIGETRRCLLDRFPYALWYRATKKAVVIACLHTHMSDMRVIERKPTP